MFRYFSSAEINFLNGSCSITRSCPTLHNPLDCSTPGFSVKVAQSCPTLSDPMHDTVHEILQAKILEWGALPFSRGSSQPRDRTQVSHIAGGFFTREVQNTNACVTRNSFCRSLVYWLGTFSFEITREGRDNNPRVKYRNVQRLKKPFGNNNRSFKSSGSTD